MDQILKRLKIALGGLSLIELIFLKTVIFDKDHTIIQNGIGLYKTFQLLSIINFIFIILLAGIIIFIVLQQRKKSIIEKITIAEQKKDPLYDEKEVVDKYDRFFEEVEQKDDNTEEIPFVEAGVAILEQMVKAKDIEDDFIEIKENNDQPIIKNIADQLKAIRIHMLQDAKSIYRRIVARDLGTIQDKIKKNDKILNDANQLIIQAVNYIDAKTTSTEVDLKNLTLALQDLIKMI